METQRHAKDIAHPMYDIIDNASSAAVDVYYMIHSMKVTILLCSLTDLSSWVLTRTVKLVRCVVTQVNDILLDWLLATVNPSVDQPPIWLLQFH